MLFRSESSFFELLYTPIKDDESIKTTQNKLTYYLFKIKNNINWSKIHQLLKLYVENNYYNIITKKKYMKAENIIYNTIDNINSVDKFNDFLTRYI